MDDLLFRTVDFRGNPVECQREKWEGKILPSHPELRDAIRIVEGAIEHPDLVLQDREYENRLHHLRRLSPLLFIVAVVGYRLEEDGPRGRLLTAFIRSGIRKGDVVVNSREAQ